MNTAATIACINCIRGPRACQFSSVCNEEKGYTKFHAASFEAVKESNCCTSQEKVKAPMNELKLKEPVETPKPGESADYYMLPPNATQLQDLIAFRDMNAQLGEIFRAAYRYGQPGHHSSKERDLRKIIFYAQAELDRLEKYVGKETKI